MLLPVRKSSFDKTEDLLLGASETVTDDTLQSFLPLGLDFEAVSSLFQKTNPETLVENNGDTNTLLLRALQQQDSWMNYNLFVHTRAFQSLPVLHCLPCCSTTLNSSTWPTVQPQRLKGGVGGADQFLIQRLTHFQLPGHAAQLRSLFKYQNRWICTLMWHFYQW